MTDIEVTLIITDGKYELGNIFFDNVRIHFSVLNDLLEFILKEAIIHQYNRTVYNVEYPPHKDPDYYIDVMVEDAI